MTAHYRQPTYLGEIQTPEDYDKGGKVRRTVTPLRQAHWVILIVGMLVQG